MNTFTASGAWEQDEIDKADADLPNGLLETLGNGGFSIPWSAEAIGLQENIPAPVVIITTNEERELPAAFVRRCVVLNIKFPETVEKLARIGEVHFKDQCTPALMERAADMLFEDRKKAREERLTPPGQAEYLDMLRAICNLEKDPDKQDKLLDVISEYCLKKYPHDDELV